MRVRTLAMFGLSALVLGGCVPKKDYEALQKELADTKASMQKQIDDREKKATDLQTALDEEKKHGEDLDAQIADLKGQIDAAQKDRADLQSQLAGVVKDRSRLKGSIEDMQRALDELGRRKAESDKRVAEFRGLLDRFKTLIDAGKLKVKIVDGRMVVELASDILFASGSANLSKDGKVSIAEIAGVLASIPDRKFQVEGHTDNVPIKTAAYPSNWELASARALTVVKTMIDAGMPPERVSGASFAQYKPAAPNDTVEGRSANRRIEIVVLPDLGSLPGFDELNKVASEGTTAAAPAPAPVATPAVQ